MTEGHRALLVTTATAARTGTNGATLRVADVRAVLEEAGLHVVQVTAAEQHDVPGAFCLGVAVSYVNARCLRVLRPRCRSLWLDAVDSWLLVDGSGLRAGRPSYAARALRDAAQLLLAPTPDLVTWISAADRTSDRGTVRGRHRLVLPGRAAVPRPGPAGSVRRAVLAGDWGYPPNRDGLRWFVREVLPLLPEGAGRVEVFGSDVPALPPRVVAHGHVSDASELYRIGDVHVAPVPYGGGVKRKVLGPLLAGLPVVTTPAGAHGLRRLATLSVHADPAAFARALTTRLTAPVQQPHPPTQVADLDETSAVHAWLAAQAQACGHAAVA